MSVLHTVKKRKAKSRILGPVKVVQREDYDDLDLDAKVEFIRNLAQLGLLHVKELLNENLLVSTPV